jgi:hypothetical protein
MSHSTVLPMLTLDCGYVYNLFMLCTMEGKGDGEVNIIGQVGHGSRLDRGKIFEHCSMNMNFDDLCSVNMESRAGSIAVARLLHIMRMIPGLAVSSGLSII